MNAVFEARDTFRDAWPLRRYGKLDNVFYQAVRFISPRVTKDFTPRRARSIYEGTARRIDSEEMDAIRAALIEESRREQEELRARLAALDETIASFEKRVAREALAERRQSPDRLG
jgi:vacuolar-type H+-ATPase subunit I/STV1